MPIKRPPLHLDPRGRTAIYRFYDARDRLLYAGITDGLKRRWAHHAKVKDWWPSVSARTVVWHGTRLGAAIEEHRAIHSEDPQFNATPYGDNKLGSFKQGTAPTPDRSVLLDTLRRWRESTIEAQDLRPHYPVVLKNRGARVDGRNMHLYQVTLLPDLGTIAVPKPAYANLEVHWELLRSLVRDHAEDQSADISLHYGDRHGSLATEDAKGLWVPTWSCEADGSDVLDYCGRCMHPRQSNELPCLVARWP